MSLADRYRHLLPDTSPVPHPYDDTDFVALALGEDLVNFTEPTIIWESENGSDHAFLTAYPPRPHTGPAALILSVCGYGDDEGGYTQTSILLDDSSLTTLADAIAMIRST